MIEDIIWVLIIIGLTPKRQNAKINIAKDEMMKKFFILMFAVIILCSCRKEGFVDKRFYEDIEPYSSKTGAIFITPNYIKLNYGGGGYYVYRCRLMENKIGYLKYSCYSEFDTLQPKGKGENPRAINYEFTFEILPDPMSENNGVFIRRTDYDRGYRMGVSHYWLNTEETEHQN